MRLIKMDLQKLLEQAQAMQASLSSVETQLKDTMYEGSSNGVKIVLNGENEVQEISIPDDLMDKENKEMLQDVLLIAFNNANEKIIADRESKMNAITQNVHIPGM